MGGAYGRYAPSSPSHSKDHALALLKRNGLKQTDIF